MTDEELVASVQKGNKEKFSEIIERYEDKLYFYIRNMINQSPAEVEDVLQEVFISSFINIMGFEKTKKFSSWIYRIAHNKAVDYIKHKKTAYFYTNDTEDLIKDNQKLIEDIMIEEDEKKQLYFLIQKLKGNYKEVILLYYFENKSYEEISDILRIPVNNVGVSLLRAKTKLKQLFNKK